VKRHYLKARNDLDGVVGAKIGESFLATSLHGLLSLTYPHTGIGVFLVRLVSTVGVTDLRLEVFLVLQEVVAVSLHVRPLAISVDVHLDNTVLDSGLDLFLGRSRSSVEDEVDGERVLRLELLVSVLLVLREELGLELDVSGLVDTVDVSETGSDGEGLGDGGKGVVDFEDVLGLSVEGSVVDAGVVDTILLTTGNTDFHLEPKFNLSHTLEVLLAGLDVLLLGLFGEIEHVGGEKGFSFLLVVSLIGIEHTVEPGKELLGAVVGVENDGDAVGRGDSTDVVSGGDGTSDGSLLLVVSDTLSGEVSSSSLRDLEDDRGLVVTSGLKSGYDSRGRGDVESGDSVVFGTSMVEELDQVLSGNDTSGNNIEETHFV